MSAIYSKRAILLTVVVAGFALSACSVAPPGTDINDPYESVNRQIHEFNVGLDQAILNPAGEAANALPREITIPVINFSDNAALPGAVVNGLLQGDLQGAASNTLRFLLNTTIGIFGLMDPAEAVGLVEQETDFGETLAVWGVPEGAYLELPGLGPSTERDAAGRVVDFFLDPLQFWGSVPYITEYAGPEVFELDTVSYAAEQIIERGENDDLYDQLLYESADSYSQLRLIYLQNRRFELGSEAGPATEAPAGIEYIDPYEGLQ